MSSLAYGKVTALARLATMVGAAPLLAPVLKLFSNNFTPDANTILADFTECAFGGYVAGTDPFGAPGLDPSGIPVAPLPFLFTTNATPPGQAYGVYIVDSAGAYVAGGRFDPAPVAFASPGDLLSGVILFSYEQGTITIAIGP